MAVLVAKGTCQKCNHEEHPIRHTECFGAWVKQNGEWSCYECEAENASISCTCDSCGHHYKNTQTVKWHGDLSELSS